MPDRYPRARTGRHPQTGDVHEDLAITGALVVVALAGIAWGAGEVSARLTSGAWPRVGASDMGGVVLRLSSDPGDPAAAFPSGARSLIPGAVGYWATFAFLLIALAVCAVAIRAAAHRLGTDGRAGRAGQGWARPAQLRPLRIARHTSGRLVLGRGGSHLLAAEPRQSVLVLGPTQSLKTTGLAVPAILEWDGPVIATSVKTDLVRDTRGWRERHGPVWVYDPSRSTGLPCARWSPLAGCHTWEGALRTAARLASAAKDDSRDLQETDFWHATAAKLLAPLLFAAATSGGSMADVLSWLDRQEEREVMRALRATGIAAAASAAQASFQREDRQKSSVYTTAETVLRAFEDPAVTDSTMGTDIDLAALVASDGGWDRTLYVCAPQHEQRRLRPLFATLVSQAIAGAYEQAARSGGALPRPLLVVLDEAANIAPLRDLDALASTAAGNGVQLVSVFQDLAQIEARYGERAWTVVNNHRAKIVLSGVSDPKTLEWASQLLGEEEVRQQAETRDESGGRSRTESPTRRRLAPAEVLRQVAPGEGILIYGHLPPARLRLRPWFSDLALRRRASRQPLPGDDREGAAARTAAGTLVAAPVGHGPAGEPPVNAIRQPVALRPAPGAGDTGPAPSTTPQAALPAQPAGAAGGQASPGGLPAATGMADRLVGDVEAAFVLGISRGGLDYRWRHNKLPCVQVSEGGRVRRKISLSELARARSVSVAEVETLLAEHASLHARTRDGDEVSR